MKEGRTGGEGAGRCGGKSSAASQRWVGGRGGKGGVGRSSQGHNVGAERETVHREGRRKEEPGVAGGTEDELGCPLESRCCWEDGLKEGGLYGSSGVKVGDGSEVLGAGDRPEAKMCSSFVGFGSMVVVCGAVELSSAGKHPVEREVGLSGGGCCLRSEAPLLQ
jgi:hypothetical protein